MCIRDRTGTRTIGERFKSYILPSFILSSTATAASETNRMVAEIVAVAQADAWWDTPDIVDIFPGAVVALKTAAEALEAE
jgi:hypothetical protein